MKPMKDEMPAATPTRQQFQSLGECVKKWKAEREKQEQERYRPSTPAQITARRAHFLGMIEYHEREADRYRQERAAFEAAPEVFHAAAMGAKTKGIV